MISSLQVNIQSSDAFKKREVVVLWEERGYHHANCGLAQSMYRATSALDFVFMKLFATQLCSVRLRSERSTPFKYS